MSRLDDIKEAYDNIQVPAELKERVLQSMERGKKDACGEKKESGKAFAGKSERNQKKGHLLPFVRVAEAVAAAVAVLVISVNVSPTVANAMEQVQRYPDIWTKSFRGTRKMWQLSVTERKDMRKSLRITGLSQTMSGCLVFAWIRLLPWAVRTVLQRYTILTRRPER